MKFFEAFFIKNDFAKYFAKFLNLFINLFHINYGYFSKLYTFTLQDK